MLLLLFFCCRTCSYNKHDVQSSWVSRTAGSVDGSVWKWWMNITKWAVAARYPCWWFLGDDTTTDTTQYLGDYSNYLRIQEQGNPYKPTSIMEWERDFEHCSNILILVITRDNDAEPADRMGFPKFSDKTGWLLTVCSCHLGVPETLFSTGIWWYLYVCVALYNCLHIDDVDI